VDDFERGDNRLYVLGGGANIRHADQNDPRGPLQLDTDDVNRFPRWVRFEPDNEWDLEGVIVTLNPGDPSEVQLRKLAGISHLWMGQTAGKFLFL
jgi:hypothetical protein